MKTHNALDPERLHTLAALMRTWALSLAGWLAGFEGVLPASWRRELSAYVRAGERDVRRLVICIAVAKLKPVFRLLAPARRAPSVPPGFRRTRHHGDVARMMARGLRVTDVHGRRGTLAVRIARLRGILSQLGRHVAAMVRRIVRDAAPPHLAPVAPPVSLPRGAWATAPMGADTS